MKWSICHIPRKMYKKFSKWSVNNSFKQDSDSQWYPHFIAIRVASQSIVRVYAAVYRKRRAAIWHINFIRNVFLCHIIVSFTLSYEWYENWWINLNCTSKHLYHQDLWFLILLSRVSIKGWKLWVCCKIDLATSGSVWLDFCSHHSGFSLSPQPKSVCLPSIGN